MHSSRMRTARLLTVSVGFACPTPGGGGLHRGGSSQPGGGVCIGGGSVQLRAGPHPAGGSVQPWEGVCIQGGWANPPVNRMTHRCKNISLPQTSFAGGKYVARTEQI